MVPPGLSICEPIGEGGDGEEQLKTLL